MTLRTILIFAALLITTQAGAASQVNPGQIVYGYNGNHLVGEVRGVFGPKAEVRWFRSNGRPFNAIAYWDIPVLAIQVFCSQNSVCETNTVHGYNGNHLAGKVDLVFENGMTEVRWELVNGSPNSVVSYWNSLKLAVQTPCAYGICAGDQVYGNNGNHLTGFVRRVFTDSVAEVTWTTLNGRPYYGVPNYWTVDALVRQGPHAAALPSPEED